MKIASNTLGLVLYQNSSAINPNVFSSEISTTPTGYTIRITRVSPSLEFRKNWVKTSKSNPTHYRFILNYPSDVPEGLRTLRSQALPRIPTELGESVEVYVNCRGSGLPTISGFSKILNTEESTYGKIFPESFLEGDPILDIQQHLDYINNILKKIKIYILELLSTAGS